MISEFLLKGIDNIFHDKLSVSRPSNKSIFTREAIKRDLSTVIRTKEQNSNSGVSPIKKSNIQKNIRDIQQEFATSTNEEPEISKSRLKSYLENDRENKLKSVIRRGDVKSKSPIRSIAPPVNYHENPQPVYEQPRYSVSGGMAIPPQYARYQQPPSQYLQAPQAPQMHQPYHQPPQQPYPTHQPAQPSIASKYYQGRRSVNPLNYGAPTPNYEMRMSPSPNRVAKSSHNYRMF